MKKFNSNPDLFPEEFDMETFKDLLKNHPLHQLYAHLLEQVVNSVALREREEYLKSNEDDSANGFYTRKLSYVNTPLNIQVPRTRTSNFFPGIVPKYSRTLPESYDKLVLSIILNTRSIESEKRTIRHLCLPVREDIIEEIINEYTEYFNAYTSRELESDWLVVFADSKVVYVREGNKVKKETYPKNCVIIHPHFQPRI